MSSNWKNSGSGRGRGGGNHSASADVGPLFSCRHRNVEKALQANGGNCDSWSLYFDKFSGYSTKKEPILNNVILQYDKSQEFLKSSLQRKYALFSMLRETKGMRLIYLENRTRLFVDMGHSCVLENVGFAFERISGLPCVPGSALKGVVANWALWDANGDSSFEEGLSNFKSNRALLDNNLVDIFGANEGDAEQGKVNFYGIFPLTLPRLEIDILTPHSKGNPIPNHFLTVAAGTKWFVPIAVNRGDGALLDRAETLVKECLTNYGVGAKTASGYGKFDVIAPDELSSVLSELNSNIEVDLTYLEAEKQRLAAEKAEEKRKNSLSQEDLAFENFCKLIINSNALKGRLLNIATVDEQNQRFILRLLKTDHTAVWQEALKDYNKGEKKGKKGYKRAKAVMEVAAKLGVEL